MAKTKISEYSTTAGNNTDINSINLAEGCAPSGINDAIRELMRQLKEFQTGGAGDSVNSGGDFSVATNKFNVASATGVTSTAGNLGVGLTPSSWTSSYKAVEVGTAGSSIFSNGASSTVLSQGFINNSGNKYAQSSYAVGGYQINGGAHSWFYAASGTSGNAVSLSQVMTLHTSGGLSLGNTTDPGANNIGLAAGGKLQYSSTAYMTPEDNVSGARIVTGGIIRFDSGGTIERMRLDSSGNLGLGVTPSAWHSTYVKALQIGDKGSALSGFTSSLTSIHYTNLSTNAYYDAGGWKYIATNPASLYQQANEEHRWSVAPSGTAGNAITFTQAMTLDASGNLGIGKTNPAFRLEVVGGTTSAGNWYNTARFINDTTTYKGISLGYDNTSQTGIIAGESGGAASNIAFWTYTGAAWGERARIDSNGILGVGVTPSTWSGSYKAVEVGTAGSSIFSNGASSVALGQGFSYNSGNKYTQSSYAVGAYQINAGAHAWFNAASGTSGNSVSFTQAMTLDTSGNLLVGHTAPGVTNTKSIIADLGADGYLIVNHSGSASGSGYQYFGYNGGIIGSITQSGTTAVLYNVTSDYRLKTVIGPVADAGQRIDALQPIEYTWNADGSRTRGFLAHQFQEVYASSVSGTKDAVDAEGKPVYQSMQASTSEVIADLVAEIQSLRARVAALES